jgi:hypothetical protein
VGTTDPTGKKRQARAATTSSNFPDSLSLRLTDLDADTGYYALVEIPLNGIRPRSLDSAVDASVEDGRAKVESGRNTPVTATEISRTTGDFEGVETRKYRVNLAGDGFDFALNGLIFYRNDFMVRALVSSNADIDHELAEHFLTSLKTNPQPDQRGLPQRLLEIGD